MHHPGDEGVEEMVICAFYLYCEVMLRIGLHLLKFLANAHFHHSFYGETMQPLLCIIYRVEKLCRK